MVQLRRILSLAVCFSVCLIVCVSPVLAVNGTLTSQSDPIAFRKGSSTIYPINSLPSTVTMLGDVLTLSYPISGCTGYSFEANGYTEITLYPNSGNYELKNIFMNYYYLDQYGNRTNITSDTSLLRIYKDNSQIYSGTAYKPVSSLSVSMGSNSGLGFRLLNRYDSSRTFSSMDITFCLELSLEGLVSSGGSIQSVVDSITVQTGILEDISSSVDSIDNTVSDVAIDVSDIKTTVNDTHDQLENPDSNIWQAAGSVISGAIESLFVPSEQDIANVKQGFDDLAQDKLGGAYTAMETVEDTITQVNDKLNNPSAAEGVEFPGIAVPLGGDVGTVVLAERQMVTLPMELTAILHPLGGTIISIIAGLGTFNVLKDMVECFLSGFSYAEYLHRNKGGSDE